MLLVFFAAKSTQKFVLQTNKFNFILFLYHSGYFASKNGK